MLIDILYVILSCATLVSIWAITNHRHSWGVPMGLILQVLWIARWVYTGQYDVIIIDLGILSVYGNALYKRWRRQLC